MRGAAVGASRVNQLGRHLVVQLTRAPIRPCLSRPEATLPSPAERYVT